MRIRPQVPALLAIASALAAWAPAAWSIGDDPVAVPKSASTSADPDIQAKVLYNTGIEEVRKADDADASTAKLAGEAKAQAAEEARTLYSTALGKFQRAVRLDTGMFQAWNYVGYTNRKLGDYDEALGAYERALALQPDYPEAIEYRAEAYLAVGRLKDAEQSYLDLFAGHRAIADKLLDAMKTWVASQRVTASGTRTGEVNDLDKWVQERSQIAGQTAALTREGAASSWK